MDKKINPLAGLFMGRMLVAESAIFLIFHTARLFLFIFSRTVIALLTFSTF
jgi:hypothetical protein